MGHELSREQAADHIHGVCFKTGPPQQVGIELEWLVHDRNRPHSPVSLERLDAALAPITEGTTTGGPTRAVNGSRRGSVRSGGARSGRAGSGGGLPHRTALTREPGGQLELSAPPAPDVVACVATAAEDLDVVRRTLADQGLQLRGYGLDPFRNPPRVLDHPRYAAMETYLDRIGPWGRMMMRATAAVQVNLDAGTDGAGPTGYRERWQLVHRLGPVLVAAFANSPLWQGKPTGWRSTRQAAWEHLDPSRTRPPGPAANGSGPDHGWHDEGPDGDPRAAWVRYAMSAGLLCLRRDAPRNWTSPPGHTFSSWLAGGITERPPTLDDLDYHLSTLFPPVRPRGYLELRMIDAQPGDGWIVPALVAATLMDDPAAAQAAWAATEPLCPNGSTLPPRALWTRAARMGLSAPELGKAALACFAAVDSALSRPDVPAALRGAVAAFAQRYPERGRCPADDLLDDRVARPNRLEGSHR
ncbi:ergothioneine biosynthesis glutamate--cysteine ligase EgtA [Streptacidiphilus fuscans]|uniref:Glutamate--cysteine ligase EgtA n=1 Tax=Streptacidiphilus fuscans TaxID=2789292 RepID=A0A931FFN3_9ACTN|nr:ergothioneine biosynthesis glutamate--cysteine ligase EgtA [Streptacidiphilus fuscans]MBF9070460.1 ergothioneine biosynthesis glutamate--cysteine ligase EgtA [Streptacidiphilus fuscans]